MLYAASRSIRLPCLIALSLLTAIAGLGSAAPAWGAPNCSGLPRPLNWQEFAASSTGSAILRNRKDELFPLRRDGCIDGSGTERLRLLLNHVVRGEPGTGFVNIVVIQATSHHEMPATVQLHRNEGWTNSSARFLKTFSMRPDTFNMDLVSKDQREFDNTYRSDRNVWRGEIGGHSINTYEYHNQFVPIRSVQQVLEGKDTGYTASSHLIRFTERSATDDWRQSKAPGIDIDFRNARCAFIMVIPSDTVDSGYRGTYLVGRAGIESCSEFSSFPTLQSGSFGLEPLFRAIGNGAMRLLKAGSSPQTDKSLR